MDVIDGSAVALMLPSLDPAFDVSDATIGLVVVAFTLSRIALLLLVGMLADTTAVAGFSSLQASDSRLHDRVLQ